MLDDNDRKIADKKIADIAPKLLAALVAAGLDVKPHTYCGVGWELDDLRVRLEEAVTFERGWPRRSSGTIKASFTGHYPVRTRTIREGKNGLNIESVVKAALEVHQQSKILTDARSTAAKAEAACRPLATTLDAEGRAVGVDVYATPRGLEVRFGRTQADEAFIRRLIAFLAAERALDAEARREAEQQGE